jgi:flagellar biosynthesis protein FlhG
VGKTVITSNIGATLCAKGYRVGFIDGDLRGANLHTCVGVRRPTTGLQDFLSGRKKSLQEVALETSIPGSWLISGASDIVNLANPKFSQKQRIINALKKMESDYIFIDLGAGTDAQVSDFFAAFPYGIVVCDSLPTSIENAYGFLKNGVVRGLVRLFPGNRTLHGQILRFSDPSAENGFTTLGEMLRSLEAEFPAETRQMRQWIHARKTFLVLNMVREQKDIDVGDRFRDLARRYLGIDIFYIGYVYSSPEIRRSVRQMRPIVLAPERPELRECFEAIAHNLLALTKG